ncbi:hypothetical protein [Amycolatopsis sacchari]|uniref:hypothetical protein n=1 Tax=Amycolatopsis sacchari TaxID=115433 RepID=UPI000B8209CA|nr:hypothetical protein [Amycolatopsis sacchari]
MTLDWELRNEFEEAISNEEISPEARTARYRRRITVREIMLDATLRLLHTAGFITMKDHEEGDYYHYRVIAAPGDYPS